MEINREGSAEWGIRSPKPPRCPRNTPRTPAASWVSVAPAPIPPPLGEKRRFSSCGLGLNFPPCARSSVLKLTPQRWNPSDFSEFVQDLVT